MEDPNKINFDVTASGSWDKIHGVHLAGLYSSQAWVSIHPISDGRVGEWIQVDLHYDMCVNGVVTQGRLTFDQWVTQFKVAVGTSNKKWKFVFDSEKRLHVSITIYFMWNQGRFECDTKFPWKCSFNENEVKVNWWGRFSLHPEVHIFFPPVIGPDWTIKMLLWEDRQSSTQRTCYFPSHRWPCTHLFTCVERSKFRVECQVHNTRPTQGSNSQRIVSPKKAQNCL